MSKQLTHASLFSGIGGAELAAAWIGWRNIFHCEINPFARKVLEYHFPNSISYDDITKTDFSKHLGEIDILTGGFPCQPFSLAGKRRGSDDNRYLWDEMLRVIRQIKPAWVVGENVAGILSMVQPGEETDMGRSSDIFEESHIFRTEQFFTIEQICRDIEDSGYTVQPFIIPACAVGAPHRRDRVWIIAHRTDSGIEAVQQEWTNSVFPVVATPLPDSIGCNSRCCHREERFLHNDITWNSSQNKQQRSKRLSGIGSYGEVITNPNGTRFTRRSAKSRGQDCDTPFGTDIFFVAERFSGEWLIADPESTGEQRECEQGQREGEFNRRDSSTIPPNWDKFPTQPPVCSGDDGISSKLDGITFPKWRAESVKAYGNAWVPQVALEIFRAIEHHY